MNKSSSKKPVLKTSKPAETPKQYKSAETVQESDDESDDEDISLNGDGRNEVKIAENGNYKVSTNPELSAGSVSTVKMKSSQKHGPPIVASSEKVDMKVGKRSISSIKSKIFGNQGLNDKDKSSDIIQSNPKSETETDSESESGSEERADPSKRPSIKDPTPRVVQPYKPPQGFEAAAITLSQSSELANLFSPSSLRGKQIWHISTPSSVPISSIKDLSLEQITNKAVLLSHQGSDYSLIAESLPNNENEILLLPSSEFNDYKPTDIKPSKILRLQQFKSPISKSQPDLPLPNGVSNRPKKPPRQQPKGLKMRYHPFGDYSSSSESSASEPSSPSNQFRIPPTIVTTPPEKKRKRDANEVHDDRSSSRRSKKIARVESETKINSKSEVRKSHHDGLKKKEKKKKKPELNIV